MLNLRSFLGKEDAMMPNVQLPATDRESTPRTLPNPMLTRRQGPPTPEAPPITHAWSIGTTRMAQERPAQRRKEECPPEVYIG